MTANLPNVNFLIALSWKNHLHHSFARSWFGEHRHEPFATCPITESGFVRLSMNQKLVGEAVSFKTASSALSVYLQNPNHRFWPADIDFITLTQGMPVVGYRQISDAYLLGLALRNDGKLITFDRKLNDLVSSDPVLRQHLVTVSVVPPA